MKIDTIIKAGWIIPVVPENQVYPKHAIAVSDGKIIDILPWQLADDQFEPQTTIELFQHCLLPGLINAHTHAAMTLMRGIADDLALMDWLQNHIWPLEQQWVDEDFVADGTCLAIAEMLQAGITCFNDMYFFPEITAQFAQQMGIRACIGLILIDAATNWAQTPDQYFSKGLALHDQLRGNPFIRTAFAPHAPYTVCDTNLKRMRALAHELEIPIHMHIHETADEVNEAMARNGKRPLQRLSELELLSDSLMGVHMVHVTDAEIEQYAQSGAHIVHCPSSNLKLASGFCPVNQFLNAGINVALGTDSASSNNQLDILGELRCAALLGKAVANDASAIPAHSALAMATINGAKALALDETIGSLESGKSADLIAVDMDTLATRPMFDPISQLVYATQRHQVTDVWVAGQHRVQSGHLTEINITDLKQKVADWQHRLA
ncbi:MAG TPA: TRZ/ATZ family hydrolase [Crenotrichaceae bacterium]|nr:TRZ/ATZ family hydrolase [Crenotrichaceae bacterium]